MAIIFKNIFGFCKSLCNIQILENWSIIKPLENWNVSNCHNFQAIFQDCTSLFDIKELEMWNLPKYAYIGSIFDGCEKL